MVALEVIYLMITPLVNDVLHGNDGSELEKEKTSVSLVKAIKVYIISANIRERFFHYPEHVSLNGTIFILNNALI